MELERFNMSDSLITKKAIAASMKELMKKKSLDKITVADIVKNCGLNRQTFYYHFQDKYDLVNWIYYNEIVSAIAHNISYHDWSEAILDVLNIMKRDKSFYMGALDSSGRNLCQEYFFSVTKDLLLEIVNGLADSFEEGRQMEEADKNFIAEFYAYGLVGIVLQWASRGMKEKPQEIVCRLKHFVDDSKRFAAARYFKDKDGGAPSPKGNEQAPPS